METMVTFKNAGYPAFLADTAGKRIILFGAGGTFRDFLVANGEKLALLEAIDFILDNDVNKVGQEVYLPIKTLQIQSIADLLRKVADFRNYIVLLLAADKHVMDIVDQFDALPQFDGVSCYYGITSLTWGREAYPPLPVNAKLPAPSGSYSIPKVIHYVWFGRQPMGELIERCIASWRGYCPNYELKLWHEDNYDLSRTPLYVRQAYEAGKYAFVSDYVRLDVVYRCGGFYLDTDVELLRSLDDFAPYQAVFGYETRNLIATGLCFGAGKGNNILHELLHVYNDLKFLYPDGTINDRACPYLHTDCFREMGLQPDNQTRLFNNALLLSSHWLCPINQDTHLLELRDNTTAVHYFNCSWFDNARSTILKFAQKRRINHNARLLADWKRARGVKG
ncbi:MAG: hypothetical protein LBK56_03820 [Gracilibacteraceae bacterium]|jgi:hypothetical protein|nr:hypothetical protein [Gracilibacteraceae bacterium]